MKIAEIANNVDLVEVAQNDLDLDLHFSPSSLRILSMIYLDLTFLKR